MSGEEMDDGQDQDEVNQQLPFIPEEVWEVILRKVKEPEDLYSCYNTCLLWRALVKDSLTAWFFKMVFPPLFPYLSKREILGCRAVCKAWTEAVDDTLINHDSLRPFDGGRSSSPLSRFHSNKAALQKWESYFGDVYRFDGSYLREGWYSLQDGDISLDQEKRKYWRRWEGMVNHHRRRNPFIGNSLKLTVWDQCLFDGDGVLKEKMGRLISQFGRHVLHLDLYSQSYSPSSGSLYKFLCHCLEASPRLRKLRLGGRYGGSLPDSVRRQDECQRLPEHPSLETIELATLFDMAGGVAHADLLLERYSRQLRKVQVRRWKIEHAKLPWPILTELQVRSFESPQIIGSLVNMNSPCLKKLDLCLTFNVPSQTETLLRILNRFPELVILKLEFSAGSSPATLMALEGPGSDLVAPATLKLLEVGRWPRISLPFLSHFPSIRYLHLWGIEEQEVKEKTMDGPSWLSKILKVLPLLGEVTWGAWGEGDSKIKRWTREAILNERGNWI